MIMKKKCIPHIFAVAALAVVVVVLGACVSLTPEEREAKRAAQEAQRAEAAARQAARLTDGKGGTIVFIVTVSEGQRGYVYRCDLNPSTFSRRDPWIGPEFNTRSSERRTKIVDEDGEYLIRYSRLLPPRENSMFPQTSQDINDWRSKTVYVSNDETVTVNIP
jgi:hypothetical protein